MFFMILFAFLLAKIKGYRILPILKVYALYPYAFVLLLYLFLQVNVFLGNYTYIQYSSMFKTAYLYTLIIPLIIYKLYKPGFYGSALIMIGTLLNKFVMSQNNGKMPVFASLSKYTGYYDESVIGAVDNIHITGDASTKYKFLTDYIDVGYSILSVGDVLIHAFAFIVIYHVIKEINSGSENTKDNGRVTLYGDS